MRLTRLLFSFVLFAAPFAAAHADPTITFAASGTFVSGSELLGTVTFDPVTGTFLTSDLSTTGPNAFTFNNIQGQPCDFPAAGDCELSFTVPGGGLPNLNLAFSLTGSTPGASFVGYNGGQLASITDPADDGSGFVSDIFLDPGPPSVTDQLASGTFTFVSETSPVPEPSTLVLLGTGTLSLMGFARRRLVRA